jgi:predicted Fe-S protein YdhL (DUF1289 family)
MPEMSDDVWKRAEVDSPCIKICVVHAQTRLCTGCLRSIDEIAGWSQMSPDARSAVMDALPDRANLITKRRGGRAARLKR